jgi:hypothetical protein
MNPAALNRRALRMATDAEKRARILPIALSFNVVIFVALAIALPRPLERIGCTLTAVGWLSVVMWTRRALQAKPTTSGSDATTIQHQRYLIERDRRRTAGWPWLLAAVPGPLVFMIAESQRFPEFESLFYGGFVLLGALVIASVVREILRDRQNRDVLRELADSDRSSV